MAEIISFDGVRKRAAVQVATPQVTEPIRRKGPASENQWTENRVLSEFQRYGMSVEQIAARERLSRLRVQQIVRAALPPTRRAA